MALGMRNAYRANVVLRDDVSSVFFLKKLKVEVTQGRSSLRRLYGALLTVKQF
jgi:hypothetical protein